MIWVLPFDDITQWDFNSQYSTLPKSSQPFSSYFSENCISYSDTAYVRECYYGNPRLQPHGFVVSGLLINGRVNGVLSNQVQVFQPGTLCPTTPVSIAPMPSNLYLPQGGVINDGTSTAVVVAGYGYDAATFTMGFRFYRFSSAQVGNVFGSWTPIAPT